MPDKELVEIRLSKVIHAKKWRVIRLITRVQDFPSYMPNVKEATVIDRRHNVMRTRWHVQTDGVPIRWVEEDTVAFHQDAIFFRAIEGDLEEFSGEWHFKAHPEGTEVSISVFLRVGIPAFKDFAEAYIQKLLTRNFEAILDSIERHVISRRYFSFKQGDTEKIAGFGIIGHLYNFYHLEKCLKMLNPNFKMPSYEFLSQLFHITPSFKFQDITDFKSKSGQSVNGCLVLATFIPDMIERDIWTVFSKVVKACKVAEKAGVGIVTLGGFTSIVAERIGHEISQEVDVPVTTGNTFTAAMAVDGVLRAAEVLNLDINSARVAIIGGTGDIGSACARVLVDKVKQLAITGRTKENIRRLRGELAKKRTARILATTDNELAVKYADIVIACASASAAILKIDWFKPGAIICDVGYPKNVSYMQTSRKDILIFSGGLSKTPTPFNVPIDLGLPSPETMYGCFAEAIILAFEKRYENYSFGRGNIVPEKVDEIRALGKKHGFEVADFYWGNRLADESIFEGVREAIHENKTHCAGKKT